ncbi:restriction endonuclease [Pseudomonas sp. PDM29]|uniref:restriction endonuclease n=1 Tax=Pseudomonas sp. PDM29 TaxID=2854771 RepID=UPI001C4454C5|nr:restriction endonuclease [Pseudomonas sp. PDM29]MBV7527268.1 restriction endonuclease [Pseudomonas sp. PDM29]
MEIYGIYKSLGYDVLMTGATGDFGVDIIARSNSEKIGVQCKNLSSPVGVDAIMQIYSGGKFYGCTRYCIITTKGYTDAAVEMAKKLGVEILIHRKM